MPWPSSVPAEPLSKPPGTNSTASDPFGLVLAEAFHVNLSPLKQDILKLYTKLRTSLEQERAEIQTRLSEIDAALGTGAAPEPASTAEPPIRRGPGRPKGSKRKMSPANKAKLIAGIKARWAKWRAEKGIKPAKTTTEKPKRKMSAAGKARIAAAAKARWAKYNAEKAGKAVAAPKAAKTKKFFSPAGRARLAAAAKARWAKVKAAGKSTL
jgi:hypothetical protein